MIQILLIPRAKVLISNSIKPCAKSLFMSQTGRPPFSKSSVIELCSPNETIVTAFPPLSTIHSQPFLHNPHPNPLTPNPIPNLPPSILPPRPQLNPTANPLPPSRPLSPLNSTLHPLPAPLALQNGIIPLQPLHRLPPQHPNSSNPLPPLHRRNSRYPICINISHDTHMSRGLDAEGTRGRGVGDEEEGVSCERDEPAVERGGGGGDLHVEGGVSLAAGCGVGEGG